MRCACINKIFDLSVSAKGPTRMVIEDQSIWMDDAGFDDASVIDVHIKSLTARGVAKTIPLVVKKQNILTAKELYDHGKDGQCIKDDIYCFSVFSCGIWMHINRSFLPSAKCALDALRGNGKDCKDEDNAMDVWRLINEIESQIILDRVEQAKETYNVLSEKLKILNCECCS